MPEFRRSYRANATRSRGFFDTGWRGNPRIWTVREGAITGQTTPEKRVAQNTFLIWTGGDVKDFELRLKFRLENGNSGIYYRSRERVGMEKEAVVEYSQN